jgi:signal transduction histidine kinase
VIGAPSPSRLSGASAFRALRAFSARDWVYQRLGESFRVVGAVAFAIAGFQSTPPHQRWLGLPLVALTIAAGMYAVLFRAGGPVRILLGLALAAACGDAMYLLIPHSVGWVVSFAIVPWSIGRLPARWALPFVIGVIAALAVVGAIRESPAGAVGLVGGCIGFSMIGLSARVARRQAEDARRLLASELATREANARTQVLAERQRLAREIHDILAHTLSAQVVQLESARLMLDRGAAAETVRAQIDQAQRLAREGLAETKRALYSLRGDARPVRDALAGLAATAGASFVAEGDPRAVEPEASLALERTVQEALTNTRKHAPGARVAVTLRLGPDGHQVEVRDDGPREPAVLADSGGGYGLTGMRERAELLGGRLEAGPDGKGFRVWLWIPA